jgi:hypothetical protein
MRKLLFITLLIITSSVAHTQEIAVLEYGGGGDWYSNPTSLPNLVRFCNQEINTKINERVATVRPSSIDLFNYPFVHMTGHGNVFFSDEDAENLRKYLLSGGFLHIDDNYGMDQYLRKELAKIFPEKVMRELPADHPLFNSHFNFPQGLPKIHEHDNSRPQAFGIEHEGRLVLLYTYECDLGDGWEDQEVHNDPQDVRLKALRMGANIIDYVFGN